MKHSYSKSNGGGGWQGFSLVEMLVVLAILGSIAALLFPVFARARQKTGNALCVDNLHHIYLATQLYVQDNDHVYPFAITENMRKVYLRDPNSPGLTGKLWAKDIATLPNIQTVLDRYDGKTRAIFHCPFDKTKKLGYLQVTNFATYGLSYVYNDTLGLEGTTDAAIQEPSKRELVDDVLAGWHTPEIEPADDMNKRRGNVQFVDGHCKAHFFRDCNTVYMR